MSLFIMSWEADYESIKEDLRHCHWEDWSPMKWRLICRDLRKNIKRHGLNYTLFPPTFRWHLCSSRLSQGKFDNWDGWEYRSNWSITFQGWNGFQLPIPKWDGRPVDHLVISSEQGIGDEILYGSAIPELIVRLGYKPLELQCHPRLIPVFRRSFKINCTPRRILSDITEGDAIVALADLFMFYRRDKSHFPKKPFLKVDPDKVKSWQRYFSQFPKPWIGIAWSSRHGSIDPKPLLDLKGSLFDCQYGDHKDLHKLGTIIPRLGMPTEDMDDHLAAISCLDRVVSVTQTLVHEAGALGIPCDAIKPPKGTGETDAALWYYNVSRPGGVPHHVYGGVTVWKDIEDFLSHEHKIL